MLTIAEIESRCVKIPWSGCWVWEGATTEGYGQFKRIGKTYYAHHAVYGDRPQGMHVLHTCDVRCCCNPDHLWLGTNTENIADSMAKGRRKGKGLGTRGGARLRNRWSK